MSVFSLVQEATGDEPRSYEWYRNTVRTIFKQSDLFADLAELEETLVPSPGSLYLFEYRAVYAERLNFYDRFPLVYVTQGGLQFKGYNLHYLNLRDRLYTSTVLQSGVLPKIDKRAFHSYLTEGLETPMFVINSDDYKTASFLPVEDFGGLSKLAVWNGAKQ